MANLTLKLLIDSEKNSLTFSKNYRIFSTLDPTAGITGFTEFLEDLIIADPSAIDLSKLNRYFRYSRNRHDWSLWYEVEPGDLGEAGDIVFEDCSEFYFEIKYEYDDGTCNELGSIIQVNEIKLRFAQASNTPNTYAPLTQCSDEGCTSIIAKTDPSFKPYNVDSAIGMFKELSFYTNVIFGHEVVYFRTLPESDSGDFVFKEWTLFKNVDRKCLKVAVPKNAFPSNQPKFAEFGLDFELPFEVHVDHRYFQSIFGKKSQPRYRDFLYFPLINRMYEVQGSYLHRGFMMEPTMWKVSLKKYNPNIDMLLTDDSRHFLDNVVSNAEQLFGEDVENDIKDSTMPKQYDTISQKFDSSRNAIHPDLRIKPLKYTYNYASLIENYYDLSAITYTTSTYELLEGSPLVSESILVENLPSLNDNCSKKYDVLLAYQGSGPFKAWRNNALITTDKNVKGNDSRFIKVRAPLDTLPDHIGQTESGRYIRIEAYKDLSFSNQKNIMQDVDSNGDKIVKFKIRETSILYNSVPQFNSDTVQNLSYTAMFNLNTGSDVVQFLNGYDNESQKGFKISGQFSKYFNDEPEGDFTLSVDVNSTNKSATVANLKSGEWYAMVVSISNEFNQCGIYIYSMAEDSADVINHNEFNIVLESKASIPLSEFNLPNSKYYIPSSNMWIANIRLFNTMIKEDQHEFILSQQYIKDESKLLIIDNCKPQLNLPYIAKNK